MSFGEILLWWNNYTIHVSELNDSLIVSVYFKPVSFLFFFCNFGFWTYKITGSRHKLISKCQNFFTGTPIEMCIADYRISY